MLYTERWTNNQQFATLFEAQVKVLGFEVDEHLQLRFQISHQRERPHEVAKPVRIGAPFRPVSKKGVTFDRLVPQ